MEVKRTCEVLCRSSAIASWLWTSATIEASAACTLSAHSAIARLLPPSALVCVSASSIACARAADVSTAPPHSKDHTANPKVGEGFDLGLGDVGAEDGELKRGAGDPELGGRLLFEGAHDRRKLLAQCFVDRRLELRDPGLDWAVTDERLGQVDALTVAAAEVCEDLGLAT
eukprot:3360743-Rhodomonas_salina.1